MGMGKLVIQCPELDVKYNEWLKNNTGQQSMTLKNREGKCFPSVHLGPFNCDVRAIQHAITHIPYFDLQFGTMQKVTVDGVKYVAAEVKVCEGLTLLIVAITAFCFGMPRDTSKLYVLLAEIEHDFDLSNPMTFESTKTRVAALTRCNSDFRDCYAMPLQGMDTVLQIEQGDSDKDDADLSSDGDDDERPYGTDGHMGPYSPYDYDSDDSMGYESGHDTDMAQMTEVYSSDEQDEYTDDSNDSRGGSIRDENDPTSSYIEIEDDVDSFIDEVPDVIKEQCIIL
jgi:hypothetical protein